MMLNGVTRTYELDRLGVNARCRIEEMSGRPFEDVLRELAGRRRPAIGTVRQFLSALLLEPAHPSPDSIDPILQDVGGVPAVRKAAQAAWRAHRLSSKRRLA